MEVKRTFAFWLIIGAGILLDIMCLLVQTMAFINYDFTISLGIYEPGIEITEVGVALN